MNVLAVISPGLKVLFERVGKAEVINRPDFFRFGGTGAVIACNHVGWADSLWMAYAVYPRQLRYMSKQGHIAGPSGPCRAVAHQSAFGSLRTLGRANAA
jgi:1-acyl-sn-glycerol-3-phosphate acyltransferase